ncbi:MAG: hypothetical protein ABIK54_01575 [candidate division WOR-3 bacterium]
MKRRVLLLSWVLIFALCGRPPVVWQTWIDTGTDERCVKLLTADENLLLVANLGRETTGRSVGLVQFLDQHGRLRRKLNFAEGSYNILKDAALDHQKNLYLCGYTRLYDTTICLVIRVGNDGRTRWKKGLSLAEASWANGICSLKDGVAITGGISTAEGNQLFIAVLDSFGTTRWTRTYSFTEPAEGWKIKADAQGNLTVLGRFCSGPDIFLMRLKPGGETLWTRHYDSGGNDEPGNIALDQFGNIIAVGTARIGDSTRCVILEYTADGGAVRKVAYGENAQAEGNDIGISPGGTIIICGTLLSPKQQQLLVFEYLPNASSIWERQLKLGPQTKGVSIATNGKLLVAADVVRQTRDIAVLQLDWQTKH